MAKKILDNRLKKENILLGVRWIKIIEIAIFLCCVHLIVFQGKKIFVSLGIHETSILIDSITISIVCLSLFYILYWRAISNKFDSNLNLYPVKYFPISIIAFLVLIIGIGNTINAIFFILLTYKETKYVFTEILVYDWLFFVLYLLNGALNIFYVIYTSLRIKKTNDYIKNL